MMQFAHGELSEADGLQFYKLMGSGRGLGFHPWPDWSTYALLCVWDSADQARAFINDSELYDRYGSRTEQSWTLLMTNIMAKGKWSGRQPFEAGEVNGDGRVAVITRATIKVSKLVPFWKYVPTSQRPIENASGLLYTKGIGEVPVVQMATFSLWQDKQSLLDYAYGSAEHRKAIEMTRSIDWYKEELFSRFAIVEEWGSFR